MEAIAEARIREWLARSPEERKTTALPLDPALPLEVQLLQDIEHLDALAMAETTSPADATALRQRAGELMIRVLSILESEGRHLAARHFAEQRLARLTGRVEP